jgi:hypothetical protein
MNEPLLIARPMRRAADPQYGPLVELYEESFSPRFRDDVDYYCQGIQRGLQQVCVVEDRANDDRLAGFYSIEAEPDDDDPSPVLYLPYFATHKDYRGKRVVGPALWKALVADAESRSARAILIEVEMEVDDPEYWESRIKFYLKQSPWRPRLLMGGYRFYQTIDGRPDSARMYLMVAAPEAAEISPETAYEYCAEYFCDAIERTDEPLTLEAHI